MQCLGTRTRGGHVGETRVGPPGVLAPGTLNNLSFGTDEWKNLFSYNCQCLRLGSNQDVINMDTPQLVYTKIIILLGRIENFRLKPHKATIFRAEHSPEN